MTRSVAIFGGGIAGLSAAHELIERGFEVHVYELKSIPGGKARSVPVPGTGVDGRKDLPGEHGFRFFPRFYKHVIDTMRRTPIGDGRTAFDNLTNTSRVELAQYNKKTLVAPSWFPRSIGGARRVFDDMSTLFDERLGISRDEFADFGAKIWQIVTSCGERRAEEYEKIPWWEFIDADNHSQAYQKFLASGITRSLVAAKARLASTKTIGDIFVQLMFDIVEPGESTDRVLNGPTNEAWIRPWLDYLLRRGVHYHLDAELRRLHCRDGRISGANVAMGGKVSEVRADHYLCAIPVEKMMRQLTDEMLELDPGLAGIKVLGETGISWMNGLQIYLTQDIPITHGHTVYVDSQWALTSISQKQFWPDIDLATYGDGRVKGIISVDISDWGAPGLNGKCAKDCSRHEVMTECWRQMKESINVGGVDILKDEYLHHWFLDPDIYRDAAGVDMNSEPLLVNLVDSWKNRPDARTQIPNLYLASDYVRTFTDLATMEGANEAARRAVNAILEESGSSAPRCELWPLTEPVVFAPFREIDRLRWEQGLPWDDTLARLALDTMELAEHGLRMFGGLAGHWMKAIDLPVYRESPGIAGNNPARGAFTHRELSILEAGIMQFFVNLQKAQHGAKMAADKLPALSPGKPLK